MFFRKLNMLLMLLCVQKSNIFLVNNLQMRKSKTYRFRGMTQIYTKLCFILLQ